MGEALSDLELLNQSEAAILAQGGFSIGRVTDRYGDICVYRGPDGKKCAAGQLIRDDQYDPKFEGNCCFFIEGHGNNNEYSREIHQILEKNGYNPVAVGWLQSLHDNYSDSLSIYSRKVQDTRELLNKGFSLEDIMSFAIKKNKELSVDGVLNELNEGV